MDEWGIARDATPIYHDGPFDYWKDGKILHMGEQDVYINKDNNFVVVEPHPADDSHPYAHYEGGYAHINDPRYEGYEPNNFTDVDGGQHARYDYFGGGGNSGYPEKTKAEYMDDDRG